MRSRTIRPGQIISLFLILTMQSVFGQGMSTEQIDSLVNSSLEIVPQQAGNAVVVVKDGKVVHSKGYGIASLETGAPVDEHTLLD